MRDTNIIILSYIAKYSVYDKGMQFKDTTEKKPKRSFAVRF